MKEKPLQDNLIKVYVYGAGGHANVVKDVLHNMGVEVVGTFDDDLVNIHDAHENTHPGISRRGVASFEHLNSPIIIGIGDNRGRRRIAEQLRGSFGTAIHSSALVSEDAEIGEGSVLLQGCIVQTAAKIGKHVLVNTGAQIDHDNVIGDFCHISPNATLCGYVEIGEGTHIGASSTVIPSIKIGRWCTIGAGAVVIGDVPDYATVVGNPAKIIKRRHVALRRESGGLFELQDEALVSDFEREGAVDSARSGYGGDLPTYDLTLVGGGVSSSFTLMNLLESFSKLPPASTQNILVIDDSDSFFAGLPYSDRSGHSSLLITNLVDFLPEPELTRFKAWLVDAAPSLLEEQAAYGGDRVTAWVKANRERVLRGDVETIYLPRVWIGKFLRDRVQTLVNDAEAAGHINFETKVAEVVSIEQRNRADSTAGYRLTLSAPTASDSDDEAGNYVVTSQRVVVAIGAPPVARQWTRKPDNQNALFLENLYEPCLDGNLKRLKSHVASLRKGDPNRMVRCLVIGANASSMEFLYHLQDIDPEHELSEVTILSPSAQLPSRNIVEAADFEISYKPVYVNALRSESVVIADDILEAVELDVQAASEQGIPFRISFPTIWRSVDGMLSKMSRPEKLRFAAHHGVEIGRLQRRMGSEHADVVEQMQQSGRLRLVKGRFSSLSNYNENDQHEDAAVMVEYVKNEEIYSLEDPVHIVVNCGPVDEVNPKTSSKLLRNLLTKGLVVANKSRRGVTLNNRLEAENGLYFIGPTIAGNIIDDVIVWHAEHCGRLLNLSGKLAQHLHDSINNQDESLYQSESISGH